MKLLKFWPTEEDCLECIKPEAENPSDAVFLAVHQEMRFVRKSFQTDHSETKSQQQLLKDFLRDEPSGRVIMPILGESGIGKSHLVRWIDIQLRQRDDSVCRHVIRIPKSSSLKTVLRRILDGLEGPQYEEIRTKLKSAREQMDEIGAKQRIRAELLAAIERRYQDANKRKEQQKVAGGEASKEDQQWLKHGDNRALPAMLNDPATQVLFTRGTSTRPGIISELARHITSDTSEDDAPRRQFEQADFKITDELAKDVKEAGPIAARYTEKLQRPGFKALEEAVDLLNSVVDDAIATLATPADTSLAELFYDVRRQLLSDGKELVLLVEDFAVLAGVQKAILDAIIREGESGGKKEACTIRTALAVTDGYFGNLDTVKTRAIHGWWITSGETDTGEAVEEQVGNFVAAYVNAARIGAKKLKDHYKDESNIAKSAPNAKDFLNLEPEEVSLLESFGQSAHGFNLFPFNQKVICTIADWKLRDQKGKLRFHPRSIINEIVLPMVKNFRLEFEKKSFPPENFFGYPKNSISTDLATDVNKAVGDLQLRERYQYLLHFWAGQPQNLEAAELPAGVYEAFGLDVLDGSKVAADPDPIKPSTSSGDRPSRPSDPPKDRAPEEIQNFIDVLDNWKRGETLSQVQANEIRSWINSHLFYSINWEAELLKQIKPTPEMFRNRIYLPRSSGNRRTSIEKAFVAVATDEEFENDVIVNPIYLAIRAMKRYDYYKGWGYDQADDDYIALANFIDKHVAQATQYIRDHYKNVNGNPVGSLAQNLLWQARLLNVESAHKADDASQLRALFASPAEQTSADDDSDWIEFIGELSMNHELLQRELVERVGAHQGGTGNKPYAIDACQILPVVRSFRKTWEISESFPEINPGVTDEIKDIDRHTKSLRRSGKKKVEMRRKRISDQSRQIVEELGKDYDKHYLIKNLNEVCTLLEKYGLKGDVSVSQIRKLLEKFKDAPVKAVGGQVEAIVSGSDTPALMTAIAELDNQAHALLVEFVETCSSFLKERSSEAQGHVADWTPEVVTAKTNEVAGILEELDGAVSPFGKGSK
jgi:hypothetical protein